MLYGNVYGFGGGVENSNAVNVMYFSVRYI